jgi:hypothetical protein
VDDHSVMVWDFGPQPPVAPVKPAVLQTPDPPPGAHGNPEFEPTSRRFAEAQAGYLRDLENYRHERAAWERASGGGPIEILTGQRDIVEVGRGRYVRTLPPGVKPGLRSGDHRVNLG